MHSHGGMSGYGWGDTAINPALDTWLNQNKRNTIILLHPHPDDSSAAAIVGSATIVGPWRSCVWCPSGVCETSMRDIEGGSAFCYRV